MTDAVILSAARTPVGKFLGALKELRAVDLGVAAARAAIERAGVDPASIDEVIMGNVVQAGNGQNPARQVALRAGVPDKVAALTVNKVCGSGLKAVMLASQGIRLGEIDMAVAGGMESMTNAPYLLEQARQGYRLGNGQIVDSMIHDGLWCAFDDWHMGNTGELVAEKYGITREEQDQFAAGSHRKAIAVQSKDYYFLGPDNGVLSLALAHEKKLTVRCLENKKFRSSHQTSSTFHGRDIFSPAAAHLARSRSVFNQLGKMGVTYTKI